MQVQVQVHVHVHVMCTCVVAVPAVLVERGAVPSATVRHLEDVHALVPSGGARRHRELEPLLVLLALLVLVLVLVLVLLLATLRALPPPARLTTRGRASASALALHAARPPTLRESAARLGRHRRSQPVVSLRVFAAGVHSQGRWGWAGLGWALFFGDAFPVLRVRVAWRWWSACSDEGAVEFSFEVCAWVRLASPDAAITSAATSAPVSSVAARAAS